MEAIVAVYEDWGIGCGGTQPVALSADRKFFRERTKGSCVIVGRRTLADFPGGQPLKGRRNLVLTRGTAVPAPAEAVHSPAQAAQEAGEPAFVIGGGSVYRQMLDYCDAVLVTRIHCQPESDTFFPDLDQDPAWHLAEVLQSGEENGIRYEMCRYERAHGRSKPEITEIVE